MKIYQIQTQQKLPISLSEAWEFLSNPANLQKITPPEMGFKIVFGAERKMYAGQLIQYTVTPLAGIRTTWVSEITQVQEGVYFVDEQRYGPYSLWHHKHFLKEIPGGVLVEDLVHYKVPLGILGQAVHPIVVRPKLKEIFTFRESKLIELFGAFQ